MILYGPGASPRSLTTYSYPFFCLGGHLIDWNFGVSTEGTKRYFVRHLFLLLSCTSKRDRLWRSRDLLWGRYGFVVQWNSSGPDYTDDEHMGTDEGLFCTSRPRF